MSEQTDLHFADDEDEKRGGAPMSADVGALDGAAGVGAGALQQDDGERDDSFLTPDD